MQSVRKIPVGKFFLEGILSIPDNAKGIVFFVHGSGSSRFSSRNNFVANLLNKAGLATFLPDLLLTEEDTDFQARFDIDLLTSRVETIIDWMIKQKQIKDLPLGLFGASTGAAAALRAAVSKSHRVSAIVCRGGRPDLTGKDLIKVKVPTLFIVGGEDGQVIDWNKKACDTLSCKKKIEIIPGATHLFEETGCLERVAKLSEDWFFLHLKKPEIL